MKRRNKVFALLLSLLLAVSVFPLSAIATEASDNEVSTASADAAAISTVEQFLGMTAGKNYYLAKDIDFSKDSEDWSGSNSAYTFDETTGDLVVEKNLVATFAGVFDGRGFSIYGFKINYAPASQTENTFVGVFGKLGGTCATVVNDLKIGTEQDPVEAMLSVSDGTGILCFGFLAGLTEGSYSTTVNNVHIYGDFDEASSVNVSSHMAVGGFIGDCFQLTVVNCSFSGDITIANSSTDNSKYVGGFVGLLRPGTDRKSVFKNCVNNAGITLNGGATTGENGAGGIVGVTKRTTYFIDCDNTTAVSATGLNAGGILGFTKDPNNFSMLVLIADCEVSSGNVYGLCASSVKRIYVIGCSNQNTPEYNSNNTYNNVYEYVMPISSYEELEKIGKDTAYSTQGFYYLKTDLKEEKTYSTTILTNFDGVLYGNNKTIENLEFIGGGELGLFKHMAGYADSAVLKLNLGTTQHPLIVKCTGNNKTLGVIACTSGYIDSWSDKSKLDSMISDVNICIDLDSTGHGGTIGGVIAYAGSTSCLDCNVYGEIDAKDYASNHLYLGAFVGSSKYVDGKQYINPFIGCNNYANLNVATVATEKLEYIGGFIGFFDSRSAIFVECNNFGDVIHAKQGTTNYVSAFVGYTKKEANVYAVDSSNFGDLCGYYCDAVSAFTTDNDLTRMVAVNFENYGSVTRVMESNADYFYYVGTLATVDVVDCISENGLCMNKGASVKIDPAITGLRYKASISEKALAKLEEIFGEGTVSYGTIISPEAFIVSAGNKFTMEALDKFAASRTDLFANGTKAYVDVPATQWFVGENGEEKGVISGSIVNMSGLYKDRFVGRAYIKVTVDNDVVYTIYADYFENDVENSTRTVEQVASSALNDLLYKKDGSYFKLSGGNYEAVTDEAVINEYRLNVGNEGEYTKYSRYSEEEYDDLISLLALI